MARVTGNADQEGNITLRLVTGRNLRILVLALIVIGLGTSMTQATPVGGTANVTPAAASSPAQTPATNDLQKLREKAEQGDAVSQSSLGMMYHNGQNVSQSDAEALKWISKAAAQGYAPAQGNLGYLYYNGVGVRPDVAQAMQWYKRAAAQGYAPAQTSLANILQQQSDLSSHATGTVGEVAQPQLLYGDQTLASAQPENISPSGDLAKTFENVVNSTSLQRENAREQLKGKVIQWSLPVKDISKSKTGNTYDIATDNHSGGQKTGTPYVFTPYVNYVTASVTITPRNDGDRQFLASLKKGDFITFKGVVADVGGMFGLTFQIKPAILSAN